MLAEQPSEANPVYPNYTAERFIPLTGVSALPTNQCLAVLVSA